VKATERGGTAILAAFMLLVLMAGATLATSRNVVRELAICAGAQPGVRAACAADGALDWFRAWARDGGAGDLRPLLARLEGLPPGAEAPLPGPPPGADADDGDSALEQDVRLRLQRVGSWPRRGAPDEDCARPRVLWRVTALGYCRVRGLGRSREFLQARELLFSAPAAGPAEPVPAGAALPPEPSTLEPSPPDVGWGIQIHIWRPVPAR
jgi:hypothetical protein